MSYLIDTNVALRSILPAEPAYPVVSGAVTRLVAAEQILYITAQVLIEFHALATRPVSANGLGMSAPTARAEAKKLEAAFTLLPETDAIYPAWRALVDQYGVLGRQVYDTRLVAVMLSSGVDNLLTMDPTGFRRFAGIKVVEPADVR